MRTSQKPVKECEGCRLIHNDRCLEFEHPPEQWRRQECWGYNNLVLITKHLSGDGQGAYARKEVRVLETQNKQNDVEHKDAMHDKAARFGRIK